MNITPVSFHGNFSGPQQQKRVTFQGSQNNGFFRQEVLKPQNTSAKITFQGAKEKILSLLGKKGEPEDNTPRAITREELGKLARSGKLTVEVLKGYTRESLLALPEGTKEGLRYIQGIIIGDDGVPYKEPTTSRYYT